MKKRRADLDIYATILKAIVERRGISKTHIMYRANISFRQLQNYLALLLKLELAREVEREDRMTYEVTDKGKQLLEYYEKVKELMTTEKQPYAEKMGKAGASSQA